MMRTDFAVSVIIPTHNRGDLIASAVSSALQQEGCSVEVIVVDDASTDDTPEVLGAFGSEIRVIRSAQNIERGAARNLGVTNSSYPYVAFLDSDDYWFQGKLSAQEEALSRGYASFTGVEFIDSTERVIRRYSAPPNAGERVLLHNPYLGGGSSLALPRQVFEKLGGFPQEREVQGAEDWAMHIKLVKAGIPISAVAQPLVRCRLHAGNFTGDPDSVASCMWALTEWIADCRLAEEDEVRRLRARTASVIGRHFTAARRWKDAAHWGAIALSQRAPYQATRGVMLMLLSAAKALGKNALHSR